MKTLVPVILLVSVASVFASPLPFVETFEAADGVGEGPINGQNGWVMSGSSADVQSDVVQEGSQALRIQGGQVFHDLSSSNSAVWLHFQARCDAAPTANPTVSDANTSLAFFVNTNLNLVVYSNTVPVELSAQVPTNRWIRFDVYCDYEDKHWDLSMDGVNVAAGLPLYSTNSQIGSITVGNEGSSPVYIDQIDVADTEQTSAGLPDSDGDQIPDWWEQKYFGSPTGVPASDPSGNDGLTYLETYVAGVSPFSYDPFEVDPLPAGNGMSWEPVPSRVYSVYWTSSLTDAFTWVEDLPYPEAEFVDGDPSHAADPSGFYTLKVRVQ